MVKSARSKAIAKSWQNRLCYLFKKQIKQKNRFRWNIIRAIFYFCVLFYKSRNKKLDRDTPCNILECPISGNYFLNKNKILKKAYKYGYNKGHRRISKRFSKFNEIWTDDRSNWDTSTTKFWAQYILLKMSYTKNMFVCN
jgi:hypothetical protein